ncbi:MAG: UDP-N-acetylmuramate dehydrogenase [Candidatus Omnitrophota bacterium]
MFSGKADLKQDLDLKSRTSIRIGGKAKHFYTVYNPDSLGKLIKDFNSDFYLLGKGSNLLIKDCLIKRPIIHLGNSFSFIKRAGSYLEVGASTPLAYLIGYCLKNYLSGLESLAGIPASLGGLLAMNASSFGRSISTLVSEVKVMGYKGEIKTLKKSEIIFGYRSSSLQNYVILGAKFKLSSEVRIKDKVNELLGQRLCQQDFSFPSCGCIFKNTQESSAGFLIDSCGFKGRKRGQAQVSLRHANFIVNLGSAKYKDVDYLIRKIKDQIYKKYSIILQEEIKRWV